MMNRSYALDNPQVVHQRVAKNKDWPGSGGVTIQELGFFLNNNLTRLALELKSGYYHLPQPPNQAWIPKPGP